MPRGPSSPTTVRAPPSTWPWTWPRTPRWKGWSGPCTRWPGGGKRWITRSPRADSERSRWPSTRDKDEGDTQMSRPGFVLEVDERTPPLLLHEGESFKLQKFPLGTQVIYPPDSLPSIRDVRAAIQHA